MVKYRLGYLIYVDYYLNKILLIVKILVLFINSKKYLYNIYTIEGFKDPV